MKIPGRISKNAQIPPLAKWDAVLLLALFLFNFFNFSTWHHLFDAPAKPWLLLLWLYGLVGLLPLVWRNKEPIVVFATQWVLAVAAWPFMPEYTPVVGIPVALYAVSVYRSKKASLLALLASFIPSGLAAYSVSFRVPGYTINGAWVAFATNFAFFVLMAVGACILAHSIRVRRRRRQYLELEQEKLREVAALGHERSKIARELHDIVSHSVAVILLQANGAACIADTDFARITDTDFIQIRRLLANITATGTRTMTELRHLLQVLEAGDAAHHGVGTSELKPQPGLADLTALLASLRATGMLVTVHVEGTPRDLDPSLDLTAYRIVQEGLINVLKHAGKDANPRLQLAWKPQSLLIQIDNDTNTAETSHKSTLSAGRGLAGLRERACVVGGKLNAGHYKGGYRLIADLPFAPPEIPLGSGIRSQPYEDQGKVSV